MNFKEITIKDKALFDRYLVPYNPQVSEFTFTNFFMWRGYYRFRYAEANGMLCIIAVPVNSEPYALMPIGRINSAGFSDTVSELKKYFRMNGWELVFKKIPEDCLPYFKDIAGEGITIEHDRDNSDYVYLTEDLVTLKGKKFHAKRNHINKFVKMYKYEYTALDDSLVGDCIRIMEDWCRERNCHCQKGDYCEKYANIEVLENYRILGCKGALIKVGGSFEAFTVGEMLNRDTAVVHIEKASFSIDGLYSFVNQQFCENEWKHTTYINREQDLGQEGLRKAKLSYNPVRMVEKYIVAI